MPAACASCIGTSRRSGRTCFTAPPASPPSTRKGATSSTMSGSAISGTSHRGFHTLSRVSIRTVANSFLITDWFKHVPTEVLAKNFGVAASFFGHTPDPSERYIFPAPVPGPLSSDKIPGATAVPQSFSHRLMAQEPIKTKSGTVRISDSSNFPVSTTIAAALVEVNPGGMRELHWHPNTDEWQYYIEGQARMGVFAASE